MLQRLKKFALLLLIGTYVKFVYTVYNFNFSGKVLIHANNLFIKMRFYKYNEKLVTIFEIITAKPIYDFNQDFHRLIF